MDIIEKYNILCDIVMPNKKDIFPYNLSENIEEINHKELLKIIKSIYKAKENFEKYQATKYKGGNESHQIIIYM